MMRKHWLLALFLVGCGASDSAFYSGSPVTQAPPAAGPVRARGGVASDAQRLAGFPKALDPSLLGAALRPKASATDFSPVLDQGYLESCGAFGLAYETAGYEIRKARGLTTAPGDCLSPAFMYRKALDIEGETAATDSDGTCADSYFNYLVHGASANLASVAYPPPTSTAQQAAVIDGLQLANLPTDSRLTIGSWTALDEVADPSPIKAQLDAGHVVGVLMQLPANFDGFYHNTGVFRGQGHNTGGHFMCVVDYDDTRQAFRVQNSWGSDFGDQGYLWWGYESFIHRFTEAYVVEPVTAQAAGPSGGALSGGAAEARLISLHQAQKSNETYLIFRVHLGEAVDVEDYRVTTPAGRVLRHTYHGHALRSGVLHLSRQDGQQWPAGTYHLELRGRGGERISGTGQLSPIAGLPSGEPEQVTGGDGQPLEGLK